MSDKVPNSHPALEKYVKGRYDEPELPGDYGRVHAVFDAEPDTPPKKKPSYFECGSTDAACGARVRVILPMTFDLCEDNACARCVELARIWQRDPDECMRLIQSRHDRWRAREDQRRERDEMLDALAKFHRDQERDLERKTKPQRDFGI
ncbi:hypothetical protein [Mycobacterium cookii]|nr:hypothetical protein [Mycobacterium cookii]MCV7330090.1 hypothetical protein [Mycobacterium cookii]